MKTLWVVGGGAEAVPGIRRAKAMGLRVIVSDHDGRCPGFAESDHFVLASTYDVALTVRCALEIAGRGGMEHVAGVIALVADVPFTVAALATALGVPGLPADVAQLGADKWAMKRRLQALGILTARGIELTSAGDVGQATALMARGWVVVKPVDSRGARGVQLVRRPEHLRAATLVARAASPTGRVLIEEWLQGPQISTETVICTNGKVVTPGFLDRNYERLDEFAPFVIEDGADAPSRLSKMDKAAVIAVAEHAALGVTGGVPCTVKGDLVLTPDGPAVIELALRLSGGYMSSTLVPLNTGVDLVGAAIRVALGELVTADTVTPEKDDPVAIRYLIPPGCTSHPERVSHGIGTAKTRAEAIFKARALCDPQARAEWQLGRRA